MRVPAARSIARCVIAAAVAAPLAGCDLVRDHAEADAGGIDAIPPVDSHVVPPVGGPATLDIACWNIENFPLTPRTVGRVADLIASLDLDLIVVEEIASVSDFQDLMARLPDHEGILSSHRYTPTDYQKIGFIYRTGMVQLGPPELLFTSDGYPFPRPPMKVHVIAAGLSFDAIGVHLKAGEELDDQTRRTQALQMLDGYVRTQIDGGGEDDVVMLGDFNENVTTPDGQQVFAPLLAAPDRYELLTQDAANAGERTFLSSGKIIDHIVISSGLEPAVGAARAVIPRLDQEIQGYQDDVSDHLPVIVSIPIPIPPARAP